MAFAQTEPAASLNDYVYTAPPGWTTNRYPDGIVLTSPVFNTGEKCLISMWPMRRPGANLVSDVNGAFQEIFKTYQLRNRTSRGGDLPPLMVHGISGQGWEYLIVKRGIGHPGPYETLVGFTMVAKLNDRLAVFSGLSKDSLVSSCLGELVNNVWPRFFYSLSFKGWNSIADPEAMRKRLAGTWIGGGATAADRIVFAPNGRFANAAARQQYYASNNEIVTKTDAYFGNGSYTLRGNAITLTQDDRKNQPENGFIRMEEESKDEGRTWTPVLYLLRVSSVDGKDYEMRYHPSR